MNSLSRIFKWLIFSFLLFPTGEANAQFISKVLDYLPAPGQYTNAENIGTPAAAQSIIGTNKGMVSLGAYGGSMVVYFANGIENDAANPYGVDFTVYGNPTPTWSEPGIIQVMKDGNGNGLPDETWYEIAGSDHYWNNTISGYEVTYQNSGLNVASDILWSDNQGQSGIIPKNSFHLQTYYPAAGSFPEVNSVQYKLSGTRIAGQVDLSNPGVVNSNHRAFGYADNTPVLSLSQKLPDNPYTPEVEGSGGDAIDIGWAVDNNGNHIQLDKIHFIRIYTGMNALVGWLGEVSTEITGIRDVEPATIPGVRSMIVIQDLPLKMAAGEMLDINALFFKNGIVQTGEKIVWTVDAPEKATIADGQLMALKSGTIRLKASATNSPEIFSEKELTIYDGAKCEIALSANSLKVNDRLELNGKVTDLSGNLLSGIAPEWRVDDNLVAEVVIVDGKKFLLGKQPGKCTVFMETTLANSVNDSVTIEVFPESEMKKVFVTVKTSEKTLVLRHSVWVEQFDFTSKVDRNLKDYGLNEVGFVSLAHAVAAVFEDSAMNGFAFRDDATGGSALYLWRVPADDEGSIVNIYGYGGSRISETNKRTWVVLLNQQMIVSGFDQYKVNNNDEILIYHVTDNSVPWVLTQLLANQDTVKTGQQVEVQLKKYSCSMDDNRLISVNASEAIANQQITVEIGGGNIDLTSDELGKANFVASEPGNYQIFSGIDELNLFAESSMNTDVQILNDQNLKVYPNPFTEKVRISGEFAIDQFGVFDLQGRLLVSVKVTNREIDLSSLRSGVYILQIESKDRVFHQKIVKN